MIVCLMVDSGYGKGISTVLPAKSTLFALDMLHAMCIYVWDGFGKHVLIYKNADIDTWHIDLFELLIERWKLALCTDHAEKVLAKGPRIINVSFKSINMILRSLCTVNHRNDYHLKCVDVHLSPED